MGNYGTGAKVKLSGRKRTGIFLVGTCSWDWSSPSQNITNGVICFDDKESARPTLYFFVLASTISVMVIGSFIYFKD